MNQTCEASSNIHWHLFLSVFYLFSQFLPKALSLDSTVRELVTVMMLSWWKEIFHFALRTVLCLWLPPSARNLHLRSYFAHSNNWIYIVQALGCQLFILKNLFFLLHLKSLMKLPSLRLFSFELHLSAASLTVDFFLEIKSDDSLILCSRLC